jgi:hypothetical protein
MLGNIAFINALKIFQVHDDSESFYPHKMTSQPFDN